MFEFVVIFLKFLQTLCRGDGRTGALSQRPTPRERGPATGRGGQLIIRLARQGPVEGDCTGPLPPVRSSARPDVAKCSEWCCSWGANIRQPPTRARVKAADGIPYTIRTERAVRPFKTASKCRRIASLTTIDACCSQNLGRGRSGQLPEEPANRGNSCWPSFNTSAGTSAETSRIHDLFGPSDNWLAASC